MDNTHADPIIVGIDGSHAAKSAALWAAQEAASRGEELRLIYVVSSVLARPIPAESYEAEVKKGKAALATVSKRIASSLPAVKMKTDILTGSPAGVLVAESRFASMICVGSTGIGRFGKAFLGSTAETVANDAACSVAVIRTADAAQTVDFRPQFIIAPVSEFADNSDIIRAAVGRARHHHSPVLALGIKDHDLASTPRDVLDEMVDEWREDYPDVTWYPVSTRAGLRDFLGDHPELSTMIVLNSKEKQDISASVGGIHRDSAVVGQLIVFIGRDRTATATRGSHDRASE